MGQMKPGRNDPCPCGSGKKYKRCCYSSQQAPGGAEQQGGRPGAEDEDQAFLWEIMSNLRRSMLSGKPHIEEYYRLRKLHGEIVAAMVQYDADGKFERIMQPADDTPSHHRRSDTIQLLESEFDLEERAGAQAFYDFLIYKPAPNMNCVTEEFLRNHRYRRPDIIEFLHSMLNSTLGLFEVTGTDSAEGYAYFKEVFSGAEYTVTDVALSDAPNYDQNYLYTRLICCNDICFSTGLNLVFSKKDAFIKQHIRRHAKDYNPDSEFLRFTQLYNHYSKSPDRVNVVPNTFK